MRVLDSRFDWREFFERMREAPARALLLDYDGTLAPFTADRDRAYPYPEVRRALARLMEGGTTRVAVVSGRAVADVEMLLGLDPLPEIWGSHGLEHRRENGAREAGLAAPRAARQIEEASAWIEARGWSRMLERKPFGFALHDRGVGHEEFSRAVAKTDGQWRAALESVDLESLAFDGGVEWRPSGHHKGEVVDVITSEMGPNAAVAYLGDDRTDEDAFRALSGRGLSVLVRGEFRPTAADIWIRAPEELLEFLSDWDKAARDRSDPRAKPPAR